MARNDVGAETVGPEKLTRSFREARYGFESFSGNPFAWSNVDGFGDPVGTAGRVNGLSTGQNNWVYHILGTQTIVMPVVTTDGAYNFGLDQTLADGFELTLSDTDVVTTGGTHPAHYTLGTDPGCFFRLKFTPEDVSGADIAVGFRKVEAFVDALATYTDFAVLRVLGDSSSAAGAITIVTDNDDAGETTTTTGDTAADATSIELEVRVDGLAASYSINGAPPTTTAAFSFDTGDIITPFVFYLTTTDLVGELKFERAEWGLLADKTTSTLTIT